MLNIKTILLELAISILAWFIAGSVWMFWRFYGLETEVAYVTGVVNIFYLVFVASVFVGICYFLINKLLDSTKTLRQTRYLWGVLIRTFSIVVIGVFNILLVSVFSAFNTQGEVLEEFKKLMLYNPVAIKFLVYMLYVSLLFNMILQFQKIFGIKMTMQIAFGYYRKPRFGKFIFMFVDLNDFTTITEEKGHKYIALFLQDCFSLLERSIRKYRGNIYTYIGDAAIMFWSIKDGLCKGRFLQAIFCFFSDIEKQKKTFIEKYGTVPNFKVGVAVGEVIIKEIGEEKREIIYLGDVINTSSRLTGVQKELDLNSSTDKVFITEELLNKLTNVPKGLTIQSLGRVSLKGKKAGVSVCLVKKTESK